MTLDCTKTSLKQGSKGAQVKELQEGLKKLGYYKSTIDSSFGPVTASAVKQLQKATKNVQDGWFGPKTCASFNQKITAVATATKQVSNTGFDCPTINLKKGSKGENVKTLQTHLKTLGYYTRQVDGDFGKYTDEAVRKFQTATQGLKVDGIFGPVTCKKLTEKIKADATKKATTAKKTTKPKPDPNLPNTKNNVFTKKQANLVIDGIYLIASTITPSTGFRDGNWTTVELMNGGFQTVQSHSKQLEYSIDCYMSKQQFATLKTEFDKMGRRVCNVLCADLESGKYTINVAYAWSNIVTGRKVTLKLTEYRG